MKKVLLFGVLSWSAVFSKAQVYSYIPFPDSNFVWKGYNQRCQMGNCWPTSHWTYFINGDTTINSLLYHKMAFAAGITKGYFREDTNKRVYFIYYQDSTAQEKLLYDFSLSVGDTVIYGNSNLSLFDTMAIVQYVDTPTYGGVPRRTLHLYSGSHINWIEGIGDPESPIGPWEGPERCCLCLAIENSTTIYQTNQAICPYCSYFNSIKESLDNEAITISPNPATTTVTINIDESLVGSIATITDITGREIMRSAIQIRNSTSDIRNLEDGIYFVTVSNGNRSGTRKLVVSK